MFSLIAFAAPQVAISQHKVVSKYENQKEFTANGSITFTPGFTVSGGAEFRAYISSNGGIPVNTIINPSMNAIVSYNVRVPGIVDPDDPQNGVNQVNVDVQTIDHFGRLIETQSVKSTPLFSDILHFVKYDGGGRESLKLLPFAYTSGLKNHYHEGHMQQVGYYYTGTAKTPSIADNSSPWSSIVFDNSPLNKVLESSAPGTDFSLSYGHTIRTKELGGLGNIPKYVVNINTSSGARQLIRVGSTEYGALDLTVTATRNENVSENDLNGLVYEYRNKDGQLVLKRQYNGSVNTQILSTYYVYDDLGNLCFVLPPNFDGDVSGTITQQKLDNLSYQYRYDQQQRMIAKKIPGKGWEYLIYNKLNQVVMTQDSVQRGRSPQEWNFVKYDGLGRAIITGVASPIGSTTIGANYRSALQDSVNNQARQWEIRIATGNGYTSKTFPKAWSTTLSINYYDDYDFPGGNPYPYTGGSSMTKGLLTGSKVNVLGTANMLWNVSYYDNEGRITKIFKQHFKGESLAANNYDEIATAYNFSGDIVNINQSHKVSGVEQLKSITEYEYDHRGRKINTWQTVNSGQRVLLSKLEYDDLGNLYKKNLHSTNNGATFLQTITYKYNERGWLVSASAPKLDLKLRYNGPSNGAAPQFNGNISEMEYTGDYSGTKWFKYTYDGINRLMKSAYNSGDLLNEEIEYDKIGNIISLKRGPATSSVISYNYPQNDNRLTSVSGAIYGGYYYDGNGNATSDGTKGIATITYNQLNLPASVVKGTVTASYLYDAQGTKLRSTQGTVKREYINGIQYTNGVIDFISTEEGRIVRNPSNGTYKYEYSLKDHLGNVRVSFDENNGVARVIQEDEYYAFGLSKPLYSSGTKNNYLYNGKEEQDVLSNMYDYGARFYDPVIARWQSVDPLAEKMRRHSSYSYAFNNPIRFVDPDGMAPLDDYKLMKNGDFRLVKKTDDKTDRILKTNSKDDVKTNSKGEAKVAVDGIEKGILKDGINFQKNSNVIAVGGKGQATVEGVKSFTLQLSEYVGKEIKGFSYSSNGSGNATDMLLGAYQNNNYTTSYGSVGGLIKKYGDNFSFNNVLQDFHTHPDGKLGATESAPEISQDVRGMRSDKPQIPNARFIILYRIPSQTVPAEYDYTHN